MKILQRAKTMESNFIFIFVVKCIFLIMFRSLVALTAHHWVAL